MPFKKEDGFLVEYRHMMNDYFVEKIRQKNKKRDEILSSINSAGAAAAYREDVRQAIRDSFAPFPAKTELSPEVTAVIKRRSYKIEKLMFESRPGVIVTANLYVPLGGKDRHPAVIAPCGHSDIGKAAPAYQEFCQRLAQSGFIVLIYDPINQGERNQYFKERGKDVNAITRNCCYAHNMMGKQLELTGGFFGSWRLWDGIRALDYLLSRPDVDRNRIGVTGNSGGGTLTTWLWAIEDRFTMSAPSCFITTFLHNVENELPTDCEQCPPGVIGKGIEMADFLIAGAPKPLIILGQKYDYFDRRGLEKSYLDVKKIYKLLGAPDNVKYFVGDGKHGYHRSAQEKMTAFFCRHAGVKKNLNPKITKSKPETLFASRKGEVIREGAVPVFRLAGEEAEALKMTRKNRSDKEIRRMLARILKIPSLDYVPHYRILRPHAAGGVRAGRFALDTENNVRAIMKKLVSVPERAFALEVEKVARIYIPHLSSESDLNAREIPEKWIDGKTTYLLDTRGIGESMPLGTFLSPYGKDYMFHALSLMLGESYAGRRVYDCLCALNLLASEGAGEIHLCGRGQGAVTALFASILHPRVKKLILKNAPASFEQWCGHPAVLWPAANFPRGILKYFDIKDCVNAFRGDVSVVEPWDHLMGG